MTEPIKRYIKPPRRSSAVIKKVIDSITPEEQEKSDKRVKLANKIIEGLNAKNWSRAQLAAAMNISSVSLISRWLSGNHNFEANTLFDLEKVLGIRFFAMEEESTTVTTEHHFWVMQVSASNALEVSLPSNFNNIKAITQLSGELRRHSESIALPN